MYNVWTALVLFAILWTGGGFLKNDARCSVDPWGCAASANAGPQDEGRDFVDSLSQAVE